MIRNRNLPYSLCAYYPDGGGWYQPAKRDLWHGGPGMMVPAVGIQEGLGRTRKIRLKPTESRKGL